MCLCEGRAPALDACALVRAPPQQLRSPAVRGSNRLHSWACARAHSVHLHAGMSSARGA